MPELSQSVHVRCVDDEPERATAVAASLEQENELIEAEAVTEWESAVQHPDDEIDCLVSRHALNGKDGIDLLESVREYDPNLPVVLYAEERDESVATEALSAGLTEYLRWEWIEQETEVLEQQVRDTVVAYRDSETGGPANRDLQRVFERITDGFFAVNDDWEYIYVNEEAARLVGRSREELVGRRVWDAFPDLVGTAFEDALRTAMEEQETVSVEEFYAGHETWYDVTAYPATEGISIYFRDVTDSKERQKRIERERNRYRTLFETLPNPVLHARAVNGTPVVEDVNPAFERTFGYDADAIRGEELHDFVTPSDEDSPWTLGAESDRGWVKTEVERETDRGTRTFRVDIALVDDGGDAPEGYAVYTDIDDREQQDQQLRRLYEATSELMEADTREAVTALTSEMAVDILDFPMNGIHLYDEGTGGLVPAAVSNATRERIGEPPVLDEGLAWQAFRDGEVRVCDDLREADPYNPETPMRSEMYIPLDDHGVFIVSSTEPAAFTDCDVTLARLLTTAVESALDRAQHHAELERQNERLEEFASIVSHDLRSPLNVAQGRLELAKEECDSSHLDSVERSHERMESLIDDLLVLARGDQRFQDPEPVEIGRIVEQCWQTVETADAKLVVESERTVEADSGQFKQLLENLIRNAVEHGGEDVTITVGTLSDGDGFYVADDGVGIPDGERDRIFEPGYSLDEGGTGFGLKIVRQIVDAHGWTIRVTESEDGGARFEIET